MRDTAFKRVLKNLPIGTEVKLDAPYGNFTLHKTESTPAVFIIGGIGVTPVRSMVAQATHDKTAHQITLLHASRTPADLPFKSDFEQLAKENPVPAWVVWTRFCNSGGLSHGISLTGFVG
jgi:ferredoxin-NADP reductase